MTDWRSRATVSPSRSTSPISTRAEQLAKEVAPWFGVAKVGLELYSAAGPEAIEPHACARLARSSPTSSSTTSPPPSAARPRVLGRHGVAYLNFHAAGGVDMMRAGVEGLRRRRARRRATTRRLPIAVTVLTSDPDASAFDARLARRDRSGVRRCGVLGARGRTRARCAFRLRHDRSRRAVRRRRRCTTKRASERPTSVARAGARRARARSRGHATRPIRAPPRNVRSSPSPTCTRRS